MHMICLATSALKYKMRRKKMKILKVRRDHGGEFKNESFKNFCEKHGILLEFSFHRTPQ